MRTTSATSSVRMARIVTSGRGAASRGFTAMTRSAPLASGARLLAQARQFVSNGLQIAPDPALLARAAQQIGGMVGDDQRNALLAKTVQGAAQLPDGCLGRQQILSGNSPDREHQP